ncbi:MAG: oxidoreductase [Verrucomicrobia bacterium]|jgi:DMSO/TMAO reductase YedYZ molybdopterin-dependent catalytic subunit/thiosulfate reductase cytochrome b subunit|nr:oxidoreductase [Verrucomicrobiota bacterium]
MKNTFSDELTRATGAPVDIKEFAGGIPQVPARFPEIRVGPWWVTTRQSLLALIPLGIVGAILAVLTARFLRTLPLIQQFIAAYPGTGSFAPPVPDGFPLWLRICHWLNLFLMLFMIRSGIQILADHPRLYLNPHCTPGSEWFRLLGPVPLDREYHAKEDTVSLPGWLGLPGIRHSVGLARWWHFVFDTVWLANGILVYVLLFTTDQWRRIVPVSFDIIPHTISTALQYLSLDFPPPSGWLQYNGLQLLAYFTTVFIASPLALITGVMQSPAVAARLHLATGFLNRQVARSLHFLVLGYFILFMIGHVVMVFATDALNNFNHMAIGTDAHSWNGFLVFTAIFGVIALAWMVATPLTLKYPRNIQHIGRWMIGWILSGIERLPPVANYQEKDISRYFWVNGTAPDSSEYKQQLAEGFKNYRLNVGGLVENPMQISMSQIRSMPKHEQITSNYCIQGWTGIAKWGGVRLKDILSLVQPKKNARYAVFYSFAHGSGKGHGLYYDAHKIEHMQHDQTILAYEMNGQNLPECHGAPLRLRNELELGYKQVKWVQSIEFVEEIQSIGGGEGGFNEDYEYYTARGPI